MFGGYIYLLFNLVLILNYFRADEITCNNTGTFTDDPPWNNMPLPNCEHQIEGLHYRMYTRANPDEGQTLDRDTVPWVAINKSCPISRFLIVLEQSHYPKHIKNESPDKPTTHQNAKKVKIQSRFCHIFSVCYFRNLYIVNSSLIVSYSAKISTHPKERYLLFMATRVEITPHKNGGWWVWRMRFLAG